MGVSKREKSKTGARADGAHVGLSRSGAGPSASVGSETGWSIGRALDSADRIAERPFRGPFELFQTSRLCCEQSRGRGGCCQVMATLKGELITLNKAGQEYINRTLYPRCPTHLPFPQL